MKELFREYGAGIIAFFIGVMLLAVLFGIVYGGKSGLLDIFGMGTVKQETDYRTYRDFDAVAVWHERTKPEVSYVAERGRFFAASEELFLKRYQAKDMERIIYPMDEVILSRRFPETMFGTICDIRDRNGTSVMSCYDGTNGSIRFSQPGVYEVYFRIIDREHVEATWKIPIAVDERR